ncbi:class I SAM-dependent methyltransferase [Oceanithermus sp.]
MKEPHRDGLFDTWAENYDDDIASNGGAFPFDGYRDVLDEVLTLADVEPGMRVLDLGIGTGNLAARFVRQGCNVWGIDFFIRNDSPGTSETAPDSFDSSGSVRRVADRAAAAL